MKTKPDYQLGCFRCPVLLIEGEKQICVLLRGKEVKVKTDRMLSGEDSVDGHKQGLSVTLVFARGFPEPLPVDPQGKEGAGRL